MFSERGVLDPKDFKSLEEDRDQIKLYLDEFVRISNKLNDLTRPYDFRFTSQMKEIANYPDAKRVSDYIKAAMHGVDVGMWTQAINTSGIDQLVTCKSLDKMREQIKEQAPPFSADMADVFVEDLIGKADGISRGAVKEVLETITQTIFTRGGSNASYRNNDEHRSSYRIEKSFRFSHFRCGVGEYGPNRFCHYYDEKEFSFFNDLEMVCFAVNNRPKPEYPDRFGDEVKKGINVHSAKELRLEYKTDYFKVKIFKNGNVKIDFVDEKTLNTINAWGADHSSIASSLFG